MSSRKGATESRRFVRTPRSFTSGVARTEAPPAVTLAPGTTVEEAETRLIELTLHHKRNNKTRAADLLVGPLMLPDTSGRGDVIFVLGAAVKEGCSLNVFGLRRVILAARLYHSGRAPLVLISGGRQRDMPCAVADVMAELAVDLGVPRSRVLVETASGNTCENAAFSDPILRSLNAGRLVVVTDRLHMRRAEACPARSRVCA